MCNFKENILFLINFEGKVKIVVKMALRGLLSPPSLHMRETDAQ